MKIIEKHLNLQTGLETITERELSSDEIAEKLKIEAELAEKQLELKAKEAARAAVLEKLGLTADEAATLLG